MPLVSVLVPCHNSEKTIEKCLEAVRKSTFKDYELIVIDDASSDNSAALAKIHADKIIKNTDHRGRSTARKDGFENSKGEIIVNVDSDVLLKPDSLDKIFHYLKENKNVDGVTGLLSKYTPNNDFFSQYKNLYMNYIFKKLPEKISFLYGSIFAVRRSSLEFRQTEAGTADDTELGQQLISEGKQIAFIRNLEVTHLKKYNFLLFIKNDFKIPYDWAKIFIKFKGWKQLGRGNVGFSHSPKEQLISVILAPTIILLTVLGFLKYPLFFPAAILFFTWFLLNVRFLAFLVREKGFMFGIFSLFATLLDNAVMALGILHGFASILSKRYCNSV